VVGSSGGLVSRPRTPAFLSYALHSVLSVATATKTGWGRATRAQAVARWIAASLAVLIGMLTGVGAWTPQPAQAAACPGLAVPAGDSIQAAIDANPEGTTLCLAPGTFRPPGTIYPKSYDVIWGSQGTVISGSGKVQYGFGGLSSTAHHVTLRGLIIRDFAVDGVRAGQYWKFIGDQVAYNRDAGLRLQSHDFMGSTNIHHNGRLGFTGYGLTDIVFQNGQLSYNNTLGYPVSKGGGSKLFQATNVRYINNYIHDNKGHGLQCDTDCHDVLFERNRVLNNANCGLFYEKSFDGIIRDNTVAGNGSAVAGLGIGFGSQIHLNTSQGVQIYGNDVSATVVGTSGIGMSDMDRGSGPSGTYVLANNSVHDNVIRMRRGGQTGIFDDVHDATAAYRNNVFNHNTYYVETTTTNQWFSWGDLSLTWSQWRSAGQDGNSSIAIS
jgi:parallel beta helix pectate lyase-like protein